MKKLPLHIMIIALIIPVLSSCSEEQISEKNLEDIHREQGIPVETRILRAEDFSTYISFTSTLKGYRESTGSSLISDTVEEVLVQVGDYVEKDQPVIRFPRTNPSANYYQAQAGYKAAEQAFRRVENLYESNGISRQSYDDARTQYEVQAANWNSVQDMVVVKAPLSGYITRLGVQSADNVNPGQSLFTISNYDRLSSTVWVSDREIRQIKVGQSAVANWQGEKLSGTVVQTDLSMDTRMKAFAVKVQFDNKNHQVPSGVTADLHIETSLTPESMVLHRREILSSSDGHYVYINENGIAVRKDIVTGRRQGMWYEVTEGLHQGDELISAGLSLLRNNSPVRSNSDSLASK